MSALAILMAGSLADAQGVAPAMTAGSAGARAVIQNLPGMTAQQSASSTQLYLDQFTIRSIDRDDAKFRKFYVQSDLTVGVEYRYRLNFHFAATDAMGETQSVPNGFYLVTLATFLKYVPDADRNERVPKNETILDRYVTRAEPFFIRVTNGRATTEVSLRFDNWTRSAVENTLYVQFTPLATDCGRAGKAAPCFNLDSRGYVDTKRSEFRTRYGFKSYLYSMTWIPFKTEAQTGGTNPMEQPSRFTNMVNELTLNKVINNARRNNKQPRRKTAPLTAEQFAMKRQTQLLSLNDPEIDAIGARWLKGKKASQAVRELLGTDSAGVLRVPDDKLPLLAALCEFTVKRTAAVAAAGEIANVERQRVLDEMMRHCFKLNEAPSTIQLTRSVHVGRVNMEQEPLRKFNPLGRFVVMGNITVSRSSDISFARVHSAKPLAPFIKAASVLGAMPYDYARSVIVTNGRSHSESSHVSSQEYLDQNMVFLSIPAFNVQSCLEILLDPHLITAIDSVKRTFNGHRGVYICDDVVQESRVNEVYTHTFTNMVASSGGDPFDRVTQTLNLALRGDRESAALFFSIRGQLKPDKDAMSSLPSWMTTASMDHFLQAPLPEPNMIFTPVSVQPRKIPSFLDMLVHNNYIEEFPFLGAH